LKTQRISEAEWIVMKILWQDSPCTSSHIISELSKEKSWSPTTIQTMLARLVEKNVLGYEKVNRIHNYYPLLTEADCLKEERHSFLKRLYNGSLSSLLAGFLDDNQLTQDEIDELKSLLEKHKE
jgi:BlaI family penicillinase repressor